MGTVDQGPGADGASDGDQGGDGGPHQAGRRTALDGTTHRRPSSRPPDYPPAGGRGGQVRSQRGSQVRSGPQRGVTGQVRSTEGHRSGQVHREGEVRSGPQGGGHRSGPQGGGHRSGPQGGVTGQVRSTEGGVTGQVRFTEGVTGQVRSTEGVTGQVHRGVTVQVRLTEGVTGQVRFTEGVTGQVRFSRGDCGVWTTAVVPFIGSGQWSS